MFELSRDQFYKAIPLLENGHPHPEIQSILERNNPGWVFSDRANSPKTALVWSKGMKGFYLIGNETNDAFTSMLDSWTFSISNLCMLILLSSGKRKRIFIIKVTGMPQLRVLKL
jgi:hypothetical protein